jgi:hypothetical protein
MVSKSRIAAVRGIGTFVKLDAAKFLIDRTRTEDEDPLVRNAAMDALVDMTGLQEYGRDNEAWKVWWDKNSTNPESVWQATQYRTRAAHYDQVRRDLDRVRQGIDSRLAERCRTIVARCGRCHCCAP